MNPRSGPKKKTRLIQKPAGQEAPAGLLGPLDKELLLQCVAPLLARHDLTSLRLVSTEICKALDSVRKTLTLKPQMLQQALMLERCQRRAAEGSPPGYPQLRGIPAGPASPSSTVPRPYRSLDALLRWPNVATYRVHSGLPQGFVAMLVSCGVEGGQMALVEQLVTKLTWQLPHPPVQQLRCCSPAFVSRAELVCEAARVLHMPIREAVLRLGVLAARAGLQRSPDCSQLREAVAPLRQLATFLLHCQDFTQAEAIVQLLPPLSVTAASVAVPLACAQLLSGQPESAARTCLYYLPACCGRDSIAMHVAGVLVHRGPEHYPLARKLEQLALGVQALTATQATIPDEFKLTAAQDEECKLLANGCLGPWDDGSTLGGSLIVASPSTPDSLCSSSPSSSSSYNPPLPAVAPAVASQALRARSIEAIITGANIPNGATPNSLPACLAVMSGFMLVLGRGDPQQRAAALAGALNDLGTPACIAFVSSQLLPGLGLGPWAALDPDDARLDWLDLLHVAARAVTAAAGSCPEASPSPLARELAMVEARSLLLGGHVTAALQRARGCDPAAWTDTVFRAFGIGGSTTAGSCLTQGSNELAAADDATMAPALPATLELLRQLLQTACYSGGDAAAAHMRLAATHAAAAKASRQEAEREELAEHAVASATAWLLVTPAMGCIGALDALARNVVGPLVEAGQWRAALEIVQHAQVCLRPCAEAAAFHGSDCSSLLNQALQQMCVPVANAAMARELASSVQADASLHSAAAAAALALEVNSPDGRPAPAPRTPQAGQGHMLDLLRASVVARIAAMSSQDERDNNNAAGDTRSRSPDGGNAIVPEDGQQQGLAAAAAAPPPQQQQPQEQPSLPPLEQQQQERNEQLAYDLWVLLAGHLQTSGQALATAHADVLAAWQLLHAAALAAGCSETALLRSTLKLSQLAAQGRAPCRRGSAFLAVVSVHSLQLDGCTLPGEVLGTYLQACAAQPDPARAAAVLLHDLAWSWAQHWGEDKDPGRRLEVIAQLFLAYGHLLVCPPSGKSASLAAGPIRQPDVLWHDPRNLLAWTARRLAACACGASARALLLALAEGLVSKGCIDPDGVVPLLFEAACAEAARADALQGAYREALQACCCCCSTNAAAVMAAATALLQVPVQRVHEAVVRYMAQVNVLDVAAPRVVWSEVQKVMEAAVSVDGGAGDVGGDAAGSDSCFTPAQWLLAG